MEPVPLTWVCVFCNRSKIESLFNLIMGCPFCEGEQGGINEPWGGLCSLCAYRDQVIELLLPWEMLECDVSGCLEWLVRESAAGIFRVLFSSFLPAAQWLTRKLLTEPSYTWCCYMKWFLYTHSRAHLFNQIRSNGAWKVPWRPSFVWDVGKQQVGVGIKCMSMRKPGIWGTSWYSDWCHVGLTSHFVLLKDVLSLFKLYFMRTSHLWWV